MQGLSNPRYMPGLILRDGLLNLVAVLRSDARMKMHSHLDILSWMGMLALRPGPVDYYTTTIYLTAFSEYQP